MRGDPREQRSDGAATDIRRETFPGSAQMHRIDQRQVVSPETQLRYREESREKDPVAQQLKIVRGRPEENRRQHDHAGDQKNAKKLAAADNPHGEKRQRHPAEQSADFLRTSTLATICCAKVRGAAPVVQVSSFPGADVSAFGLAPGADAGAFGLAKAAPATIGGL